MTHLSTSNGWVTAAHIIGSPGGYIDRLARQIIRLASALITTFLMLAAHPGGAALTRGHVLVGSFCGLALISPHNRARVGVVGEFSDVEARTPVTNVLHDLSGWAMVLFYFCMLCFIKELYFVLGQ